MRDHRNATWRQAKAVFKTGGDDGALLAKHKELDREVKKMCRAEGRKWLDKQVTHLEELMHSDCKKFWAELNRMGGRSVRNTIIDCLKRPDGSFTTDPKEQLQIMTEKYEALGKDEVPAGATYDLMHRARVDRSVAKIRRTEQLVITGVKGFRLSDTCVSLERSCAGF